MKKSMFDVMANEPVPHEMSELKNKPTKKKKKSFLKAELLK
jgi:hypothetical protein